MVDISDKKKCSGCSACAQRCPKHCISMQEDKEGFLYPHVNETTCIDCGICENVCPSIGKNNTSSFLGVYAAKIENEEIRMQSSSGGIFTFLAEKIIREGGVVFGARFNKNWQVIHSYTEDIEGLVDFRGSKYVQSVVGDTYMEAERFLKEGRKVLYSGTPCQIAGLKHFLQKEYDNLLSVECVCHSVPSPLVWKKYLDQHRNGRIVKHINFRDKTSGWSKWKYSLVIDYVNGEKEVIPGGQLYMKGLVANLITRPSCSDCKARGGRSGADISLGDFWGVWNINPKLDDNKGTTIVIAYSDKGLKVLNGIQLSEIAISDARSYNGGLCAPKPLHFKRESFFDMLSCSVDVDSIILSSLRISLLDRIKRRFKNL